MISQALTMLCETCEYFHVVYGPWKGVDFGRADCRKYGLTVDFASYGKLKRLRCIDNAQEQGKEG